MKGIFEGGLDNINRGAADDDEDEEEECDWVEDLDIGDEQNLQNGDIEAPEEDEETGWGLDLDLSEETTPKPSSSTSRSTIFIAPTPDMPVSQIWTQRSSLAAGNIDTAMRLLNCQLAIKNFTPLKPMFLDLHAGSHTCIKQSPSSPILSIALDRNWSENTSPNVRNPPSLIFNFSHSEEKLKAGYKATTAGKFTEALCILLNILHTIPLTVVESRRVVDEVKELIIIVNEYVLGLKMELKRREMKDNPIRQQELAAYFTHCNLQTPHLRLVLLNAMSVCYKAKNFIAAANFARRLIETNPTARQVLQGAEGNYDFRKPFVTCGATYVPIYRGQKDVACPYCSARFVTSQDGQICSVCEISVVGADASGLMCSPCQVR